MGAVALVSPGEPAAVATVVADLVRRWPAVREPVQGRLLRRPSSRESEIVVEVVALQFSFEKGA